MDEHVDRLRKRLREDPSSREFFRLGEALRRAGELGEAARVLAEGLGHHPRYVAAWVALGRVELERGRFEEAETACARALDVDPENAVAARLIGEAASRRGDWKRALAAWRLALALTPGDGELEERLARAEAALASPEPTPPQEEGPPEEPAEPPFAEELAPPVAPAPELPREVFALEDADPFAVEPRGDTGVWDTGEDVFSVEETMAPAAEPAGEPFAQGLGLAAGAKVELPPAVTEPEPVVTADAPEPEAVPGPEAVSVSGAVPEAIPPAQGEPAPEAPVGEPAPPAEAETPPSGVPLPTVTLARLALEQGDRDLARQTLEQLVALRGESDETRELAREIEVAGERASTAALSRRKIERLQGWLRAVRLAAESHGHGV